MSEIYIVRGIVRYKGKILMLKRYMGAKYYPGSWEVPGGKLEPDEDPRVAVKRELEEETGLRFDQTIKFIRQLPSWYGMIKDIKSFSYVWLMEANTDKVEISEEHTEYAWKTPEEIKKMDIVVFAEVLFKYFEWIERGIL